MRSAISILLVLASADLVLVHAEPSAPAVHVRGFRDRHLRVRNIVVTFDQETVYPSLKPGFESASPWDVGYHGSYSQSGEFRFCDGRARYDMAYSPETVARLDREKLPLPRRHISNFNADRVETLTYNPSGSMAGR